MEGTSTQIGSLTSMDGIITRHFNFQVFFTMTHIKGFTIPDFLMSSKCRNVGVSDQFILPCVPVIQIRRGWGRGRGPLHNLLIPLDFIVCLWGHSQDSSLEIEAFGNKGYSRANPQDLKISAVNDSSQDSSFLAMFSRMSEIVKSFISNLCVVYSPNGLGNFK